MLKKEEAMRKPRKKKQEPKGSLMSGVLFITDASFFAKSINPDVTDKLYNPLENNDEVVNRLNEADVASINFPNNLEGFGVLVQTHELSSTSYKVKKSYDKATGKVKKITITLL